MERTSIQFFCGFMALVWCSYCVAVPLEFRVTGTLAATTAIEDTLDGADVTFSAIIDSNTDPFLIFDPVRADYFFGPDAPTLTIAGSESSDGIYDSVTPYVLSLIDNLPFDRLSMSSSDTASPSFLLPKTLVHGFYFDQGDAFPQIPQMLNGIDIPFAINPSPFSTPKASLRGFVDGQNIALYKLNDIVFTITVVPEPASLTVLAMGAWLVCRKMRAVRE